MTTRSNASRNHETEHNYTEAQLFIITIGMNAKSNVWSFHDIKCWKSRGKPRLQVPHHSRTETFDFRYHTIVHNTLLPPMQGTIVNKFTSTLRSRKRCDHAKIQAGNTPPTRNVDARSVEGKNPVCKIS